MKYHHIITNLHTVVAFYERKQMRATVGRIVKWDERSAIDTKPKDHPKNVQ
jgi:hypothetical protein